MQLMQVYIYIVLVIYIYRHKSDDNDKCKWTCFNYFTNAFSQSLDVTQNSMNSQKSH